MIVQLQCLFWRQIISTFFSGNVLIKKCSLALIICRMFQRLESITAKLILQQLSWLLDVCNIKNVIWITSATFLDFKCWKLNHCHKLSLMLLNILLWLWFNLTFNKRPEHLQFSLWGLKVCLSQHEEQKMKTSSRDGSIRSVLMGFSDSEWRVSHYRRDVSAGWETQHQLLIKLYLTRHVPLRQPNMHVIGSWEETRGSSKKQVW